MSEICLFMMHSLHARSLPTLVTCHKANQIRILYLSLLPTFTQLCRLHPWPTVYTIAMASSILLARSSLPLVTLDETNQIEIWR